MAWLFSRGYALFLFAFFFLCFGDHSGTEIIEELDYKEGVVGRVLRGGGGMLGEVFGWNWWEGWMAVRPWENQFLGINVRNGVMIREDGSTEGKNGS